MSTTISVHTLQAMKAYYQARADEYDECYSRQGRYDRALKGMHAGLLNWMRCSPRCMPTMDHAVGTPTPLKCCWACCSMAMPLGCSVHARLSVLPMRPCLFAPLQAICIPTMIHLRRIARTFLPELKDLFVQVLLLAKAGRCAEIGYDQPRWDQGACQCPPLAKR
jgi:hypothetical protein